MIKRLLYCSLVVIVLASCSKDDEGPHLSAYNASVVSYFQEIALGFEFGGATEVTRRWKSSMKIFVGGNPSSEHKMELEKIISEINELATTDFKIELVTDTLVSNFYIYFGSDANYAQLFPGLANFVGSNLGLFTIFWNGSNELINGYMYVDIYRATPTEQRHLLREELTQSLGLAKDSFSYPESIFQQAFSTKTTEYAPIDRDVIRLLYHPEMKAGLDRTQVGELLAVILLAEQ